MQTVDFCALIEKLRELPSECQFCEFKQNQNDPQSIGRLISALSNGACSEGERFSYIVWGVKDRTHELIGTSFDPQNQTVGNQNLELWLAQMLQPSISFQIHVDTVFGKRIVVMLIPAASGVTTKFGHIAYTRIGSATPKLSEYPEREAMLTASLRPYVWERGLATASVSEEEILGLIDIDAYYGLLEGKKPNQSTEILRTLLADKILEADTGKRYMITNFGAILFASRLQQFSTISRKSPRVITYPGEGRTSVNKEQNGSRGYAAGFGGLVRYIMQNLPQTEQIKEGFRRIIFTYDEVMVREAVANALIHQDFAITGTGPMIEIFQDRVEISNPGKPLIEPSRFIDMPPRSRNELLASMMRRTKICEERGSGVDKIIEAAERSKLPAPDFRIDGDNNRVTLFGPRPFRDTTPSERVRAAYQHAVMCFMRGDRMTNASLRERLGVEERNAAQVSRVMGLAVEEGIIKQSDAWSTRSGTYVPIWA